MADLSDRMRTLLGAIRVNATAWQTPLEVAQRLGWSVDETTDLLADLDLAGLITVREPDHADPVIAPVPLATDPVESDREALVPAWGMAAGSRNPSYGRPSRSRITATAAGSVTS